MTLRKDNWRDWKIGDKIQYHYDEFDGCGTLFGIVSEITSERVLVYIDGARYWVDDDTVKMFSRI